MVCHVRCHPANTREPSRCSVGQYPSATRTRISTSSTWSGTGSRSRASRSAAAACWARVLVSAGAVGVGTSSRLKSPARYMTITGRGAGSAPSAAGRWLLLATVWAKRLHARLLNPTAAAPRAEPDLGAGRRRPPAPGAGRGACAPGTAARPRVRASGEQKTAPRPNGLGPAGGDVTAADRGRAGSRTGRLPGARRTHPAAGRRGVGVVPGQALQRQLAEGPLLLGGQRVRTRGLHLPLGGGVQASKPARSFKIPNAVHKSPVSLACRYNAIRIVMWRPIIRGRSRWACFSRAVSALRINTCTMRRPTFHSLRCANSRIWASSAPSMRSWMIASTRCRVLGWLVRAMRVSLGETVPRAGRATPGRSAGGVGHGVKAEDAGRPGSLGDPSRPRRVPGIIRRAGTPRNRLVPRSGRARAGLGISFTGGPNPAPGRDRVPAGLLGGGAGPSVPPTAPCRHARSVRVRAGRVPDQRRRRVARAKAPGRWAVRRNPSILARQAVYSSMLAGRIGKARHFERFDVRGGLIFPESRARLDRRRVCLTTWRPAAYRSLRPRLARSSLTFAGPNPHRRSSNPHSYRSLWKPGSAQRLQVVSASPPATDLTRQGSCARQPASPRSSPRSGCSAKGNHRGAAARQMR
jgi:hypothetical protein